MFPIMQKGSTEMSCSQSMPRSFLLSVSNEQREQGVRLPPGPLTMSISRSESWSLRPSLAPSRMQPGKLPPRREDKPSVVTRSWPEWGIR